MGVGPIAPLLIGLAFHLCLTANARTSPPGVSLVEGRAAVQGYADRMQLKSLARKVVPNRLYPSAVLRWRVQQRSKNIVQAGPFAGMRYVDRSIWGAYIPKLLGIYELELHEFIERMIARGPRHLIDIGGAEGYYAVGLLRRLPSASLTVFEQLADGRETIGRLAELNGVGARLEIRGSCNPEELRACLREPSTTALLSDVEGYEFELLDPTKIPELARVTMLIEVHDSAVPDCAERMAERFSATHHVTRLRQRPRALSDYGLGGLSPRLFPGWVRFYGLNEFRRPENGWLYLEPR